jgi:acetylornithine deacetylase/succinyl-diaminopimelate desuccinylase-like protein
LKSTDFRARLIKQITSNVQGITHPYLNVGMIEGGTNTNVIPARVTFKLDRRMIPEENPAVVEATLRDIIARTAAEQPGVTVEVKRMLLANAMKPLAGNQPLVERSKSTAKPCLVKTSLRWAHRCTPMCACSVKPAFPA